MIETIKEKIDNQFTAMILAYHLNDYNKQNESRKKLVEISSIFKEKFKEIKCTEDIYNEKELLIIRENYYYINKK